MDCIITRLPFYLCDPHPTETQAVRVITGTAHDKTIIIILLFVTVDHESATNSTVSDEACK